MPHQSGRKPVNILDPQPEGDVPDTHYLILRIYQIMVASSADELAEDRGSLWDSG
jgi:hypothetical protein